MSGTSSEWAWTASSTLPRCGVPAAGRSRTASRGVSSARASWAYRKAEQPQARPAVRTSRLLDEEHHALPGHRGEGPVPAEGEGPHFPAGERRPQPSHPLIDREVAVSGDVRTEAEVLAIRQRFDFRHPCTLPGRMPAYLAL